MSVVFSGSFSGVFTSTGVAKFIPLPSGVDWMTVKNETVSYAAGGGTGAEFYWRLGMPDGRGTIYTKTAATNALAVGQIAANSGFFLQDTSIIVPSASLNLQTISGATPPLVASNATGSLIAGNIVRIYAVTGALQLGGLDFTVSNVTANTSFNLAYMSPIAAATTGTYRIIPFNPYFYPSTRTITAMTPGPLANVAQPASVTVVTMSVDHSYTVGQQVRLTVPPIFGAAFFGPFAINPTSQQCTIVAIGQQDAYGYTNTITVDLNTQSSPAFVFPVTTSPGFTPAQVTPIGENTGIALTNPFYPANSGQDVFADATLNTAQIGMLLQAGTASPAGVTGNVISWVAGKSYNQ